MEEESEQVIDILEESGTHFDYMDNGLENDVRNRGPFMERHKPIDSYGNLSDHEGKISSFSGWLNDSPYPKDVAYLNELDVQSRALIETMLAEDEYYLGCQTNPFRSEEVDEERFDSNLMMNRSMLNASSCNLPSHNTRWNDEETMKLMEGIRKFGSGKWMEIANHVGTRNALQVKNRARHVLYYNKRVMEPREGGHESNGWTNWVGIEDKPNLSGKIMEKIKSQLSEKPSGVVVPTQIQMNPTNQKSPHVNEPENLQPQIPEKLESINPAADEIILEDETNELTSLENTMGSNSPAIQETLDGVVNGELENDGVQQKNNEIYEYMNDTEFAYPLEQKVNTTYYD
jgi:hypothetical protein